MTNEDSNNGEDGFTRRFGTDTRRVSDHGIGYGMQDAGYGYGKIDISLFFSGGLRRQADMFPAMGIEQQRHCRSTRL